MSRTPITLSNDERFLLNHYINIYNEQMKNIDLMYLELKETRDIIEYITRVDNRPNRNNTNEINNNNTNSNEINNDINTNTNNTNNTNTNNTNTNYTRIRNNNRVIANDSRIIGNYIDRTPRTNTIYRWDYYIPIDDLENVPIVPSQSDLNNNTIDISFNNINQPLNTTCPITLERFDNNTTCTQIIGCGHVFSRNGLQQWFRTSARCPICRYDVRTANDNTTNDSEYIDVSFNVMADQIFNSLFSNRRNRRNSST